ncbi:unnamed protein product [Lactuca virosa]|uniref:Uncharacterized protein n=1 Tax=Lactuca virosa TaxID=75947 RepID=A0AAU9LQD2_9ASTR|nr:unnamed protein product [Lactuca virosa]
MIQNGDFYIIYQVAVVNNVIISDNEIDENDVLQEDDIGEEDDEEEDRVVITQEHEPPQVPATFTNNEETNVISDGNWIVSQSMCKNDFT